MSLFIIIIIQNYENAFALHEKSLFYCKATISLCYIMDAIQTTLYTTMFLAFLMMNKIINMICMHACMSIFG